MNPEHMSAGMKLWLTSAEGKNVFGDGRWRLLEAIERTGSLKSAADLLGISYRKAWGDLRKTEQRLNTVLLTRHRGGCTRGQTQLTEVGRQWLHAYSRFRAELEQAADKACQTHMDHLVT